MRLLARDLRGGAADRGDRPDDVAGGDRRDIRSCLRLFGGYQSARTIHFFAFVALLLFVFVHVVMVIKSGFRRQMRAMTLGEMNDMKTDRLITRRRAIIAGLASVGGLCVTR